MSEAFITMAFLTVSGGLQDAYSYCIRGKVFANAQTGNVVLMSQHLFKGEVEESLNYLIPVLAFTLGVIVAEKISARYHYSHKLHWRQIVLIIEILLLFIVGFIPLNLNILANAIVSFACAMQVQSFRKVNGYSFASTMCIGNLRSGVEALSIYTREKKEEKLKEALNYFGIILTFALGAGMGGILANTFQEKLIWLSSLLLLIGFGLMFKEYINNK